jgi:hypothetical protein
VANLLPFFRYCQRITRDIKEFIGMFQTKLLSSVRQGPRNFATSQIKDVLGTVPAVKSMYSTEDIDVAYQTGNNNR